MSKVQIKLNSAGIINLLKSDEVYAVCHDKGEEILQRVGTWYAMHDVHYFERKGVSVCVVTRAAMQDNYKNNTLLKAVQ